MISEVDPVVSLALCGISPTLISAQTGVPGSAVHVRLTARETTFSDRVRAFDPHPGTAAASVISDQMGDTLTPGPCAWCGGRIVASARICRLEREVGGNARCPGSARGAASPWRAWRGPAAATSRRGEN